MDTKQKAFVARRAAAHAAGTQDIARDPLVKAAMEHQRQAREVMARWKQGGQPMTHQPERRLTPRRQAE